MRNFIIFQDGYHPRIFMAEAPTLSHVLSDFAYSESAPDGIDGSLRAQLTEHRWVTFTHFLQAIECIEKSNNSNWTVREIVRPESNSSFQHVLTADRSQSYEDYIKLCRDTFDGVYDLPNSAFIWKLKPGIPITFYKRRRGADRVRPDAIGKRFLVRTGTPPKPEVWNGSYDDIVDLLVV